MNTSENTDASSVYPLLSALFFMDLMHVIDYKSSQMLLVKSDC